MYDCELKNPVLHSAWHILCFCATGLIVNALPVPMKKTIKYVYMPPSGGVGAAEFAQVTTHCIYTDAWADCLKI